MIVMRKSKAYILLFCLAIMLFIAIDVSAEGQIVIIANKDVPVDNLTPEAIKKIFLGDTINWKANQGIVVVLSKDETVHNAFIKQYIKRTPAQFHNVWRRNLFTGKGARFKAIGNIDDLIQFVANMKGAIGYVPEGTNLPDNVKIIGKE